MRKRLRFRSISAILLSMGCLILFSACHSQKIDADASVPTIVATQTTTESTTEYVVENYTASHLSKAETETFAKEVKQELFDGDWESLSQKMQYPVRIGNIVYGNSDQILKNAEQIQADFVPEFWDNLEEETCENMFNNSEGIMLGRGQVWFASFRHNDGTEELLILAINNDGI